jgi:hypothetical protein
MKYRLASASVLAALAVASTTPALHAQTRNFTVNVAAGAAVPTGDLGNFTNVGYNLTGGIGLKPGGSALGFRAEGFFNEFGFSDNVSGSDIGKFRIAGVNGNLTYDLPVSAVGSGNALYAIAGVGYYNVKDTGLDASDSDIGWNLGAGFRFPLTGFSAYVEARYHGVSNSIADAHFIPIVFGLVF